MYLAKEQNKGKTDYIIRESLRSSGHFIHRDLFHLGSDPTKFIHYPGGNSYYFAAEIEEVLSRQGVQWNQNDLERIFFDFLPPEIQRVIIGFDRGYRNTTRHPNDEAAKPQAGVHIFDKRRYHYLRFGQSEQRYIQRVPEKIFRPLHGKSRDELEHYFESEERRLAPYEKSDYVATIFQLSGYSPNVQQPPLPQMDAYFIDRLCDLNSSEHFMAGEPKTGRLYEHLIKYAVIYFDFQPVANNFGEQYIRDFINRHRIHQPMTKTLVEIKEAEHLFGHTWKELKQMDSSKLTRIYRKMALKHHPDQGGDADRFRRLAKYYKALIERKPKA